MKKIVDHHSWWPAINKFVNDKIGGSRFDDNYTAIGLIDNDKLIAGVLYSNYNGPNIVASIAGEGKRWLTREFLWFMFYYPFEQLGVKRITTCVEQANVVSQHFTEHLGFQIEVIMKDAGRTGDLLMYRMFKDECRYLERQHGNRQKRRTRST